MHDVPVDLALIREHAERDRVHGGVAPALVEEAAGAVEVLEVLLVLAAAPEVHVADLEVGPEVAGAVAVGEQVVLLAALAVGEPVHGVVLVQVLRVVVAGQELERLRPQRRHALRAVVQIDGEAVRLVVVLHPAEDVVVNVAEEVDVRLDAPVPAVVLEGRVLVEHAAIPAAHLVVGYLVGVLDVLLLQHLDRLMEEVHVDPRWHLPVFLRDQLCSRQLVSRLSLIHPLHRRTVANFGLGGGTRLPLELLIEGLVVEEGPRIIELVVPCPLEIAHRHQHVIQLPVAHEGNNGGVDAVGIGVIGRIVVSFDSSQRLGRFT